MKNLSKSQIKLHLFLCGMLIVFFMIEIEASTSVASFDVLEWGFIIAYIGSAIGIVLKVKEQKVFGFILLEIITAVILLKPELFNLPIKSYYYYFVVAIWVVMHIASQIIPFLSILKLNTFLDAHHLKVSGIQPIDNKYMICEIIGLTLCGVSFFVGDTISISTQMINVLEYVGLFLVGISGVLLINHYKKSPVIIYALLMFFGSLLFCKVDSFGFPKDGLLYLIGLFTVGIAMSLTTVFPVLNTHAHLLIKQLR